MLKKNLFIGIFLLIWGIAVCQERSADSLLQVLSTAKEDTNKVKILLGISRIFTNQSPTDGIKYGQQARSLSEHLRWYIGIAKSNEEIGDNYFTLSNYPQAFNYYNEALAIVQSKDLKRELPRTLLSIGHIYAEQSNFPKAIEYELKSLKLAEDFNDKSRLSSILNDIGIIYNKMKDYNTALKYFFKSLKYSIQIDKKHMIGCTLGNIGLSYKYKAKYTKAMDYYIKAVEIDNEVNDKRMLGIAFGNMASVYLEQKNYPKALEYYFKSLNINSKLNSKYALINNFSVMGKIYNRITTDTTQAIKPDSFIRAGKKSNILNAINYQKKCLELSKEINDPHWIAEACEDIYGNYELLGDYKKALEYYKEYINLQDSLYSLENKTKISNLESQRELDLKDKQIKIDQLEVTKKRNERVFYIGGIVLLTFIIAVVLRNFRTIKTTNILLDKRNNEKELLIRELHHRVKNNLQVVSSLLDAQAIQLKDNTAVTALREGQNRIEAIALIHQRLYQTENIISIDMEEYALNLVNSISGSFGFTRGAFELALDIHDICLDIDIAIPLGLILNELISNSFKHAYKDTANPRIEIEITIVATMLSIIVGDNGKGVPENLLIDTSQSFGMRMVNLLLRQLRGSYELKSTKGFNIKIQIPLDQKQEN